MPVHCIEAAAAMNVEAMHVVNYTETISQAVCAFMSHVQWEAQGKSKRMHQLQTDVA